MRSNGAGWGAWIAAIAAAFAWLPLAAAHPVARADSPTIPNTVFTTQDGIQVRLYDDLIKDKVVLINFMFTSCTSICPKATQTLSKVAAGLGERLEREVRIISMSVDPRKDTPAVLKKYAERHGANAGWYFLTGKAADVEAVRDRLGVNTPGGDKSDHTGMVVYGNDRTGQWAATNIAASPKTILWSLEGLLKN